MTEQQMPQPSERAPSRDPAGGHAGADELRAAATHPAGGSTPSRPSGRTPPGRHNPGAGEL
jgi:hypothetical protein